MVVDLGVSGFGFGSVGHGPLGVGGLGYMTAWGMGLGACESGLGAWGLGLEEREMKDWSDMVIGFVNTQYVVLLIINHSYRVVQYRTVINVVCTVIIKLPKKSYLT